MRRWKTMEGKLKEMPKGKEQIVVKVQCFQSLRNIFWKIVFSLKLILKRGCGLYTHIYGILCLTLFYKINSSWYGIFQSVLNALGKFGTTLKNVDLLSTVTPMDCIKSQTISVMEHRTGGMRPYALILNMPEPKNNIYLFKSVAH